MPNWCNNFLTVEGKKEDIEKFKQEVASKNTELDFNKIIPNTKDKEKWKKIWDEMSDEEKAEWTLNGKEPDFEHYWFNESGYGWQIDMWGTKWNPGEVYITDTDGIVNAISTFMFNTAWSPPIPIVIKLIETYKKLKFNLEYDEPGMCFAGELSGKNGDVLVNEEWDITHFECPDCGINFTYRKNDPTTNKIECPDCGHIFKSKRKEE